MTFRLNMESRGATVLAQALKLDEEEVRVVACGALLHEIGKLEISEVA